MTDERKPETPGLSEVSPKFVDEAEAAVEAAGTQKAHDAIDAVLNKLPRQGEDETQIESVYRKVLALRENPPPRGSDEGMNVWLKEHDGLEEAVGTLRAENLHDVEIKLAILCYRLREDLNPGEQPSSADFIIAVAARDDLRRIGEKHVEPVHTEAQELASAERERITALWDTYKETGAVLVERDGEHQESGTADADDAVTEAMKADKAAWEALVNERCHTLSGLLVKMSAFKSAVTESDFEGPPEVLFDAIVRDLERLAGEGATTRPAAVDHIPDNYEDSAVRIGHKLWRLRQVVAKRKPTDEKKDQAEDRSEAALDEFLATPARSPEDVVLKLKVHAEFIGTERRDHIVTAAVCDLEHLATGKAPQRSPLFSRIADVETPMTDAEGAVEALWLLVEDGKLAGKGEAVAYLASHLSEHIKEQRRLFDELFVAAGGSTA